VLDDGAEVAVKVYLILFFDRGMGIAPGRERGNI
jgi:hypothetical protein